MSHGAPLVSTRNIYGSTAIHDDSARFTIVGLRILTMRPRFDTVLVRFKPVVPRHPPRAVFWVGLDSEKRIVSEKRRKDAKRA